MKQLIMPAAILHSTDASVSIGLPSTRTSQENSPLVACMHYSSAAETAKPVALCWFVCPLQTEHLKAKYCVGQMQGP
jgi:hypothetical protein